MCRVSSIHHLIQGRLAPAGLVALCAATIALLGACGSRSLGEPPVTPEPAVATDITVEIWSDGYGTLVETRTLAAEGPMPVDPVETNPYSEPPQYYVFARAPGFFTELYLATWGDVVDVDLDAVPDLPAGVAGVVFHGDPFFAPCYYASERLGFTRPGPDGPPSYEQDLPMTFQRTDGQGRYGLEGLDLGQWLMVFTAGDEEQVFTLENGAGTDYQDVIFYTDMIARAPNLYLYPPATADVRVTLGFPQGGRVVASEPPYPEGGWQVRIAPDGLVDGRFPYLFYEAALPFRVQTREGWVLPGDDLAAGLTTLLGGLGFEGREIDDFLETWVPELEGEPFLALYPQAADALVTLDVAPRPDHLRRVWLLARPFAAPPALPEPAPLPALARDGFTAVEWGVILDR